MAINLTILCENSVARPFGVLGEHGFACYLETPQGNYLFDTGQGNTIINNARVLGKNLADIKALMLSHGHYDHTGGLEQVLECNSEVDIYAHPGIFADRYWNVEGRQRYVGIAWKRDYLESIGANFKLQRELREVGRGVYLTGEIPRNNDFEKGDSQQTAVGANGQILQPDPLPDDLSMVVETPLGLIIVLGCAHAGLVNIIEYVVDNFPGKNIHAVVGGTHLGFADDEQFEKTLQIFDRFEIAKVGVSHCTGLQKAARLANRLGERFFFANAGTVLTT